MNAVPIFVSIFFALTTLLAVFFFSRAVAAPKIMLIVLAVWLTVQAAIALSGFYSSHISMPPGFMLAVLPPVIFIVGLFTTKKGRAWLDGLNIKALTILHVVRAPVELVLFWLFMYKAVPRLMTFEGRNFDILSGLSAPIIYYFAFIKKPVSRILLLIWNFICLELLLNIVLNALFSAPFPFQQFGFKQPNIAILYFPFVWLPSCIVPLVLLAHLATIRQLILNKNN
jgi:hypothetical protein